MVRVAVAVSLISKSHAEQCKGIRLLEVDDQAPLSQLQEQVLTQLPCGSLSLLYRGCDILQDLTQITLKDCCPASSSLPRFSAVYTTPEKPSQVLGDCLEGQTRYMKTLTGITWAFQICLSHTSVLDFKRMITFKSGVAIDQQRLIFAGRQLDGEGTLSSYGLQKECVLHLVVRMRRPELAVHTVDVVSPASLQQLVVPRREHSYLGMQLASDPSLFTAPEWRDCCRGANIAGKCANTFCRAYQRTVIAPVKQLGVLPLSRLKEAAKCPCCSAAFEPEAYGFTNCVWAYDSREFGNNWQVQDVCSNWQHVPAHKYQHFHTAAADVEDWHMLTFLVKPRSSAVTSLCPICHESTPAKSGVITGCGHNFHRSCLDAWKCFLPAATCPDCKGSLEVKQVDQADAKLLAFTSPHAPAMSNPKLGAVSPSDTLPAPPTLANVTLSTEVSPAVLDAKLDAVSPSDAMPSAEPAWLDPSEWPPLAESNRH